MEPTAPANPEIITTGPPTRTAGARYPNAYIWFVFLSSLDILLTYLILHPIFSNPYLYALDPESPNPNVRIPMMERGQEVNALADWVIQRHDLPGMVVYKFSLVALVLVICEYIGRRRDASGRRLAEWAVAITTIPVLVALIQMGADIYVWLYG